MRESEERFRSAFESAAIGMALVGLDGRWMEVNDAVCELLGYSREELLSTNSRPSLTRMTWRPTSSMCAGFSGGEAPNLSRSDTSTIRGTWYGYS